MDRLSLSCRVHNDAGWVPVPVKKWVSVKAKVIHEIANLLLPDYLVGL